MRVLALLAFAVCLLASPLSVLADETLTEDTAWSGTVEVDGVLEVAAGVTLEVQPGTRVELRRSSSILVRGRLLAEGTEEQPVYFTRVDGGASWDRLLFVVADDSVLRQCVIEYSDCAGDHKDYYDDKDSDCDPVESRPPRDYNEAVVVIASHLDIESCTFQKLPGDGTGEGDAIAVISDDPVNPGTATANIRASQFLSIGQGIHTRYAYVLVEDCFFTDHHGDNDDVDLYGESDPPPMIRNNVFLDPAHDDMINPTRCSAILIGNIIAGSDDHGIVLRDRCDPVLINNVIYDCSSAGIAVQNTCDALIVNNTIVNCGRGIRFFDHTGRWGLPYCLTPGSGKATVINSVVWDCPTPMSLQNSPSEADPGSHVVIRNCNIEGDESDFSISSNSTVTWLGENISADPRFVDPDNGDFRLLADSPMVDTGTGENAPGDDFDGNSRPCGDGIDIGAFELGGCGIEPGTRFRRGDTNADGSADISDPVSLLLFLFASGAEPPCQKSADADDSGVLELTDAVFYLNYLFTSGDAPPAPGRTCGIDPTTDDLTCESYRACQ